MSLDATRCSLWGKITLVESHHSSCTVGGGKQLLIKTRIKLGLEYCYNFSLYKYISHFLLIYIQLGEKFPPDFQNMKKIVLDEIIAVIKVLVPLLFVT